MFYYQFQYRNNLEITSNTNFQLQSKRDFDNRKSIKSDDFYFILRTIHGNNQKRIYKMEKISQSSIKNEEIKFSYLLEKLNFF
jgi:hypothetical protein